MWPLCLRTMRMALSRPSPRPCPGALVVKNGSKMRSCNSGGMPGPGIPNFHQHHIAFKPAGNAQAALIAERVKRVFDQRGPHLVQFAAVGVDPRQARLIVALDLHIGHARAEHLQRGVQAGRHIDFQDRSAIHAGVGLDGVDQVEDARGGVSQSLHGARGAQIAREELQARHRSVGAEQSAQLIEVGDGDAMLSKLRRHLPRLGAADVCRAMPDRILAGDEGQRVGLLILIGDATGRLRIFSSQA